MASIFDRIKPGSVIRSYYFERPIGKGGYGVVWQGSHQLLEQACAIKVIDTYGFDKQDLERVKRECKIGGQLKQKSHIVEVRDAFFEENNLLFIVMELMSNSLDNYLREYPHPDFDLTLTWALNLCTALQEVHALDVVHRDIKPQNILLTEDQRVKLSDFGVAHLPATTITTHTQPGTLMYCSPEQAANQPVDKSTDVYALCAVLFEVWVGRPYFYFQKTQSNIVREEMAVALNEHYPELKPLLDSLISTILAGLTSCAKRISLDDLQYELKFIQTRRRHAAKQAYDYTFADPNYFTGLTDRAAEVAAVLQLGREEAGLLDKKLDPDLLQTAGNIIEMLHQAETRAEAERELIANTQPDLVVAILRQSFRVRNDQVRDWLVKKLINLCQTEKTGLARQAIYEATGSQLKRLSQLADEVFVRIGNEAQTQEIARDPQRTLSIRIRACALLLSQYRAVPAAPIALNLLAGIGQFPDAMRPSALAEVKSSLFKLFESFKVLAGVEAATLRQEVIKPLFVHLKTYQRDQELREYLLAAVASLREPALTHLEKLSPSQIAKGDLWPALALRKCALNDPAATRLMLSWMQRKEIPDSFKVELSRRAANAGIQFYEGATDELTALLSQLPKSENYRQEMRQNIERALANAQGQRAPQNPDPLYAELLKQHRANSRVEKNLLWDFRNIKTSLTYLRKRLPKMQDDEWGLLLQILADKQFVVQWELRLQIVLEAYPRLPEQLRREAVPLVYEFASHLPKNNKNRQDATTFLADLVDRGSDESKVAQRYWQKLG